MFGAMRAARSRRLPTIYRLLHTHLPNVSGHFVSSRSCISTYYACAAIIKRNHDAVPLSSKAAGKRKAVTPSPQVPASQRRRTRGAAVPASPTGPDERDETPLPDRPNEKKARAFAKSTIVAKVGKPTPVATPVISCRMRGWLADREVDVWEPISRRPVLPGRNYTPLVRATDNDGLDASQLDNLRSALIDDCRLFTAIRLKVPFTAKGRLNLEMSDAQLEYHKEEWVSGKRHEGSPPDDPIRWSYKPGGVAGLREFKAPILRILPDIERWTGVKLRKGHDGCPYFGHHTGMSCNRDWRHCKRLFVERLERMATRCNHKHETVDMEVTLFLECIFQASIRQMDCGDDPTKKALQDKYKELLGLPLDVQLGNALCFLGIGGMGDRC
ncbi:hypothetical protein MAPG_02485 [Magnaporthiopsis poae ATCC 64411]|uniref:Uncharacterized protein n=1 Tax=Magnaporthiopsis poae (strain ATCC 64411 / 73-15) TaxID=644358 RepID=A0A0C4DRH7_MAGP6|nr:hypothetical protein MAPG_02485 [Magnaporthiopsis poae ATCC 64411]